MEMCPFENQKYHCLILITLVWHPFQSFPLLDVHKLNPSQSHSYLNNLPQCVRMASALYIHSVLAGLFVTHSHTLNVVSSHNLWEQLNSITTPPCANSSCVIQLSLPLSYPVLTMPPLIFALHNHHHLPQTSHHTENMHTILYDHNWLMLSYNSLRLPTIFCCCCCSCGSISLLTKTHLPSQNHILH